MKRKRYAGWDGLIILIAVLFWGSLFAARIFLYRPFNLPSASMSPSLNRGDYVLVSTRSYQLQPPQRGDVVVFYLPSKHNYFVKRIAGLPGDRVQMKGGVLSLNGRPLARHRLVDFFQSCDSGSCRVPQYEEVLPGGRSYRVIDLAPDGPLDNTDIFHVPAGAYFVLGDNRDNSADSRTDFGYIAGSDIVGRVVLKFIDSGHLTWKSVR